MSDCTAVKENLACCRSAPSTNRCLAETGPTIPARLAFFALEKRRRETASLDNPIVGSRLEWITNRGLRDSPPCSIASVANVARADVPWKVEN
jgi:hypothetical protein